MRLFIAIQLSDEMKKALVTCMHDLKKQGVEGDYVPAQNLHLTLAFIGEYNDPEGGVEETVSGASAEGGDDGEESGADEIGDEERESGVSGDIKGGNAMIDMIYARRAFDAYLDQFDRTDEKIRLKIVHTDGVVRYMTEICRRMGLPEEERRLAELIALLHDIGRFEQLKRYDSFEWDTMDHAAYGVHILFGEQRMIRRFVEEDTWDDIIREAIARHSDFSGYDPSLTSRQLLHVQLIRDADKLDNCRVKLEEPVEVLLGCTAEEVGRQDISPEVWEECLAHTSVHLEKRKTKMDYWVSYVAYFFDIAYRETLDIIREERYTERIIGRIPYENPETEQKMRELCGMVGKYFRKKCL